MFRVLLLAVLLAFCVAFRPRSWNTGARLASTSQGAFFDNSIDISPDGNNAILKRLLRKGDPRKANPINRDAVEIAWKISLLNGTLLHDSRAAPEDSKDSEDEDDKSEPFRFTVGAEPREVILGWNIAVQTMLEGEIATYTIDKKYAFGDKGAPPLIPANTTAIECEIELLRIIPALARRFKSVGMNESIRDDLMESIHSGTSVITDEAMKNENLKENKAAEDIKYFDPVEHKLDPSQKVSGEGEGHFWDETMGTMDIDIPLPDDGAAKDDLKVEIRVDRISVLMRDVPLLAGPLHGRVMPSLCCWAIVEPDPTKRYKGNTLRISLEKGHGHRDIWASVLDRAFLIQQKGGGVLQ